jgi:hypothetical protein
MSDGDQQHTDEPDDQGQEQEESVEERTPPFEVFVNPDLDAKLARISQAFGGGGSDKVARLFANKPSPGIEKLLRLQEEARRIVPQMPVDPITPAFELPDPRTMPDYRAAKAAEQTAEHLEVLVSEAIENRARAEEVERREKVMLFWTKAGVVLAAIAAVASIIAILMG